MAEWGGGLLRAEERGLASWAGREALLWGVVPAWQGKLGRCRMRERAGARQAVMQAGGVFWRERGGGRARRGGAGGLDAG
jgi:hypothetical protein